MIGSGTSDWLNRASDWGRSCELEHERGVGIILKWVIQEWGGGVAWIIVAEDRGNCCAVLHMNGTTRCRELLDRWDKVSCSSATGLG